MQNGDATIQYIPKWHESKIVRRMGLILPAIWFIGSPFLLADVLFRPLRTLQMLGIEFPPFLSYTQLIGPAISIIFWIIIRRWFPNLAIFVAIALCLLLVQCVDSWANSQIYAVPISRMLTDEERRVLKAHFTTPYIEAGSSSSGTRILIAKNNRNLTSLTSELKEFGIAR